MPLSLRTASPLLPRNRGSVVGILAVVVGCLMPSWCAAADPIRIEPRERWSNVFGGKEVEFRFAINVSEAYQGPVIWAVVLDRQTLARQEAEITASPDKPGMLNVRFAVPAVREGVVLQARLGIEVLGADRQSKAKLEKVLWIFPEDPFLGRSKWLQSLKITLFDPAKTTASVLKKAGVPFEEQDNQATLADLRNGILVIGEGASFKEEPQLADLLLKLAAKGVSVLCLAPAEGMLPLPAAGKEAATSPVNLSLRRRQVIVSLDKRLDSAAWPPDGSVVVSSLALTPNDGSVVAEVIRGEEGYAWLEMEFAARKGRLIVCGFSIMKSWDKGPTPRFLLAAVLEHMTERETRTQSDPKGANK
jgi:hypothetical protein